MQFITTSVAGAFVLEAEKRQDERGYFARAWCVEELGRNNLCTSIAQINVAHNLKAGTVRGMHIQAHPHSEVKVARCARGALYDVIVDLRPWSATFKKYFGVELTAENCRSLYIPEGCAHGYQALRDDTELQYLTSKPYAPAHATGVRYNDPDFGIRWPLPARYMSAQDCAWPDFGRGAQILLQQ